MFQKSWSWFRSKAVKTYKRKKFFLYEISFRWEKGFHFPLRQRIVQRWILSSIKIITPQRDDADTKLKFSTLVFSRDLIYVATTMTLSNARCRNGGSKRKEEGKRKRRKERGRRKSERARKKKSRRKSSSRTLTQCCKGPQINCPFSSSFYLSLPPPSLEIKNERKRVCLYCPSPSLPLLLPSRSNTHGLVSPLVSSLWPVKIDKPSFPAKVTDITILPADGPPHGY